MFFDCFVFLLPLLDSELTKTESRIEGFSYLCEVEEDGGFFSLLFGCRKVWWPLALFWTPFTTLSEVLIRAALWTLADVWNIWRIFNVRANIFDFRIHCLACFWPVVRSSMYKERNKILIINKHFRYFWVSSDDIIEVDEECPSVFQLGSHTTHTHSLSKWKKLPNPAFQTILLYISFNGTLKNNSYSLRYVQKTCLFYIVLMDMGKVTSCLIIRVYL